MIEDIDLFEKEYVWSDNINQRLGGQAGTIVSKAEFPVNDKIYVVEFYQLPEWLLTSLGLPEDNTSMYQVGFREANTTEYEGFQHGNGQGQAISIIRTAAEITSEWILRNKPDVFVVGSPSLKKFRIFKKIINTMADEAKSLGYEIWERNTPFGKALVLIQDGILGETLSGISDMSVDLYHGTTRDRVGAIMADHPYHNGSIMMEPLMGFCLGREIGRAITGMREEIADKLGCSPDQITDPHMQDHGALIVIPGQDSDDKPKVIRGTHMMNYLLDSREISDKYPQER